MSRGNRQSEKRIRIYWKYIYKDTKWHEAYLAIVSRSNIKKSTPYCLNLLCWLEKKFESNYFQLFSQRFVNHWSKNSTKLFFRISATVLSFSKLFVPSLKGKMPFCFVTFEIYVRKGIIYLTMRSSLVSSMKCLHM